MQYSTFYAKLTPNGAVNGTRYSISITGITWEGTNGLVTYSGAPLYFTIKPKSSGLATVTFKNETTGDIIGSKQILVRSTTLAKPTYSLAASATSVNEGGSVNFTLDTSDVPQTTNVPYTITGVSVDDISLNSLKGNFTIGADGKSVLPISIVADELTEGTETLTVTLDQVAGLSKSVTINDTSKTPSYVINWHGDAEGNSTVLTNVPEPAAPYLVIKTTNVPDGTVFDYEITGIGVTADDFQDSTLVGKITVNNGWGYAIFFTRLDRLTEGDEVVIATVKRDGVVVGSTSFTLVDASKGTTYQVGLYETTTSTTELTSLPLENGRGITIRVAEWYDASSGSYIRGYRPDQNIGQLLDDDMYVNGVKLVSQWVYGNYITAQSKLDYVAYIISGTPSLVISRNFRFKLTNLDNGKVYYSTTSLGSLNNGASTVLSANSNEARQTILDNLFIVGHRVKFELEYV